MNAKTRIQDQLVKMKAPVLGALAIATLASTPAMIVALQNVRSSLQQSFRVLSSPLLPTDQGVLSNVPGGNRTHI
jgi:hypothetical protein